MIVRISGDSQLLITQPDHAALGARVMRHWCADGLADASTRSSILLAVAEHDGGWREVDAAPLVDRDTGRVLDFIAAPVEIKHAVWPRAVERLAATPYAAALVAQHALHIYRRYSGDADWTRFFNDMEAERDRMLTQAAPLVVSDLLRDYMFLRLADLLSLTFCNEWTEVQQDDAGSGYSIRLEGARVVVTPDPFAGEEIPFEVSSRRLPNQLFSSASDAQKAFAAAPTVALQGVAAGGA